MTERNGSWIVSVVKWIMNPDMTPEVTHCSGRYFRYEESARDRYDAVVESLEHEGYELRSMTVPDREEYEGVSGVRRSPETSACQSMYATVFIDRNRT